MGEVVRIRKSPVPIDENTARVIRVMMALSAKDSMTSFGVLTQVQGKLITDRKEEFCRKIKEACLSVIVEFAIPPEYDGS